MCIEHRVQIIINGNLANKFKKKYPLDHIKAYI